MEKECRSCLTNKSFSDYHKNKNTKDGLHTICKECACKRASSWASDNLERVVRLKKERRKDVRKSLLEAAQNRAREQNLEINITLDDIVVPDFCPVLNIKLEKSSGKASDNSPSLDKIIPSLGYVKGNIQVISRKANTMKSNATKDELLLFAKWVLNNMKEGNYHDE